MWGGPGAAVAEMVATMVANIIIKFDIVCIMFLPPDRYCRARPGRAATAGGAAGAGRRGTSQAGAARPPLWAVLWTSVSYTILE